MKCACRICWGDAWLLGTYGDWEDIVCLGCGRYKISKRLLAVNPGRAFDVILMRVELESWRAVHQTPIVSQSNARFTTPNSHHRLQRAFMLGPGS